MLRSRVGSPSIVDTVGEFDFHARNVQGDPLRSPCTLIRKDGDLGVFEFANSIIVGAIPCGRPAPFVPHFPPDGRRALCATWLTLGKKTKRLPCPGATDLTPTRGGLLHVVASLVGNTAEIGDQGTRKGMPLP
jgi:hypothetical protein